MFDHPPPTLSSVRMSPTHQQRDLSLSDDVDDVLVLLCLFIYLSSCSSTCSKTPWHTTASTSSPCSRRPGLGGILPAHATPWEHEPRAPWRLHARPLGLGVWVDPSRQQLVWKSISGQVISHHSIKPLYSESQCLCPPRKGTTKKETVF